MSGHSPGPVQSPLTAAGPLRVRGPFFDELALGMAFDAPAVTLTDGLQAVHSSILGNRLRLPLDHGLADAVTGRSPLASPSLVWDVSIGQSTVVTQHVRANMFYRGMCFRRVPMLGETLHTRTVVEALKENRRHPGRSSTGLAALRITTVDQDGGPVLDYWRCALLPLSPGAAPTGAADDVTDVGRDATIAELTSCVAEWDLERFRRSVPGAHFADLRVGQVWEIEGADVVSSAPELARLTGNIAKVHHDAEAAGGARLVYGGHTIGLALHQVSRALPNLLMVTGWRRCDHLGPVHEGDALISTVTVEDLHAGLTGGGLADLRVDVVRKRQSDLTSVLHWQLTAALA